MDHGRKSIRKAAKECGTGRANVLRLIRERKIDAYRVGGSDDEPWLEVYVDELRAALDHEQAYVPPGARKRTRQRVYQTSALDPAARRLQMRLAKHG